MIRILMIPTGGLRREGITTSILELAKRLNKNICSITIAAVHDNARDVVEEFRCYGCKVVEFPDRKNRKLFFRYCLAIWNELKNGYDIVHVHGSSAIISVELFIAKCRGVQVRIAHSRNTRCDNTKIDGLLRPLLYKSYTCAFACGREAGEWLFPNREFEVLHNGKDFSKFRFSSEERDRIRNGLGLEKKIVYGHVGNINIQKNHSFLIDIFSEIIKIQENAVLYLMGDGPLMNEIRAKVHSYGLDDVVVFAGRVNDVYLRLMAMDVMIFPSLFEGLPNVVIEWQAEGLPCLISDTITRECALTEMVNYMSLDCSAEQWALKAISIISSVDKRMFDSEKSISILKNSGYSIKESTKHLEQIYIKLLRQ